MNKVINPLAMMPYHQASIRMIDVKTDNSRVLEILNSIAKQEKILPELFDKKFEAIMNADSDHFSRVYIDLDAKGQQMIKGVIICVPKSVSDSQGESVKCIDIKRLGVPVEFRKQGIAKALITSVIEKAKQQNVKIYYETWDENQIIKGLSVKYRVKHLGSEQCAEGPWKGRTFHKYLLDP
jgi:GNAT superfamily N-acetyltransferase